MGPAIYRQLVQNGEPLPPDATPPPPGPRADLEDWIMMAFADLSTCRAIGLATGPIPWTAVDAYAARERLDRRARQVFVDAIRALDAAYLRDQAAQRAKERPHG